MNGTTKCPYCGKEPHLRSFVEEFPDASNLHQQFEEEIKDVPVSLIMGSYSLHADFHPDWTPTLASSREKLDAIIESIKKEGYNPRPQHRIHLISILGRYWVGTNGNHRVIAAKLLNLPTVPAIISVLTAKNQSQAERLQSVTKRI